MTRQARIVRGVGRILATIGLLVLYLTLFFSGVRVAAPREGAFIAGFVLATLGCLTCLGGLSLPGPKGRTIGEAVTAFLCLPPAAVGVFLASGDDVGSQTWWVAIVAPFLLAAVALLSRVAWLGQEAARWRDRGGDGRDRRE